MAFWQQNTGFQVWFQPMTWFSTGIVSTPSVSTKKTTKTSTYNPRYPWFDEEDYKRMEKIADDKGLVGQEKTNLMDQMYQYYYPEVLNKHKLDERQQEINNSIHQNWEALLDGNKEANMGLKLTNLSQMAKQKFNIPYNVNDNDVITAMVEWIDNGSQLLYNYVYNGDPEILYVAGIQDRPTEEVQQWWVKNLINQASTSDKKWDEKNLWEKVETVTNYTNLLWLWTEKIDEAAGKFADKFLDLGNQALESTTESLRSKIEGMSESELKKYRKEYNKLAKDKSIQTAYVEWDNIVERLWNGIKGNITYRDDDEAFMKRLIDKKANLGESLTGADDVLQWESNPNVVQFFGNIPSSAVKTFTATVRWMTNPYDTMKWLYKIAATDEGHQAILDRYGSWDALANAMNNDPVWVADDMLAVAELGTNIARWWLKFAGKVSGNASLANAASKVPVVWSANDALASKTVWGVYWVMDNAAKLSDSNLVQGVNRVLQDQSSLSKIVTDWKEVYDWAKETTPAKRAKNFVDEVINKTVWIDKADREFIMNNKEIVNDYVDGRKNVETVLEDVKDKISDRQLANSEMWKEYDAIREKGQTVSTEALASDMVEKLNKNKITINADWDLEFDKLSKYNTAQQKALQDAWQVIKDAQAAWTVDAWTILDLRQKFDDKVNWTWKPTELRNMSSVDKATESLIKEMRSTIDARAKAWIDGLKALDEKYAPALEEMREIKRDWFDSNGNLKDNARSKLRNLTKAWNEEKLSRLEKVAPWITQDLKALDVAQTIDRATKQSVWQYAKWAWIAGGFGALITWNIPAALVSAWVWILATPKNFLKLVQEYPNIVEKLSAWAELLPSDMDRLQALASRLESWME